MGAGASVASSLSPTAIFGLEVAVGAAWAGADKLTDFALDTLDAVDAAAEAVTEYLRAVMDAACSAAWALEKLEKAAAFVVDRVVWLLCRLLGRRKATAARREMRRARLAGLDVFAEAASRVARYGRCIMGPAASSVAAVVPAAAAAAPGALALLGSDAAGRAAGIMGLILEAFPAEADLGDSIPQAARSSITVIAAAAVVCLDVVASTQGRSCPLALGSQDPDKI